MQQVCECMAAPIVRPERASCRGADGRELNRIAAVDSCSPDLLRSGTPGLERNLVSSGRDMGRCVLLARGQDFGCSCGVLAIDVNSQNAPCGAAVCVDEATALLGDRRRVCVIA